MKALRLSLPVLLVLVLATTAQAQFPTGNLTWSTSVNGNYTTLTNYVWTDAYGAHHFPGTATEYRTPSEPLHGGYIWAQGFKATSDDNQGYSLNVVPYVNGAGATFLRNDVGVFGRANPKYLVLSVIYTPPGVRSTVDYGTSTALGTSTSLTNSFTTSARTDVNLSYASFSFGASSGWSLSTDTTTSLQINNTSSNDVIVPGPASYEGIDHSLDIFVVWINPSVLVSTLQNGTTTYNYVVDERDTGYTVPEILNIPAKWLRDPFTMPANVTARLNRTWAPGEGLDGSDYQAILQADPFIDGGYGSTTVSTADGRFTELSSISYTPTAPGGQPITMTGSFTHTQIFGSSTTVTKTFTESITLSGGVAFQNVLRANLSSQSSMTLSSKATTALTGSSGQSARYSIQQPSSSYNGPVNLKIYQDNIYGSFVFGF